MYVGSARALLHPMDETLSLPAAPAEPRGPASALPPGTCLAGRFTLEALAGRGGMGAVYRALDSHSGRSVALKLLHATASSEAARRFAREAELLATLRHPGIVAHVAHGLTEQGQPFLAMEWLEGEDLARRLVRQPLGLREALALVRRTAEALAVAHQRGIVHRDLKPSNLFLRHGRAEEVVLLDFGLARPAAASVVVTGSGAVVGTPGYMSPEQASGLHALTPAADLFSLGCVLYECLTGQPPFTAPHFAAVLAKILFTEPAPLRSVRADLPEALQALVDRLLAKEARHRVAQAAELLEALRALEALPDLVGPAPGRPSRPASLAGAEQLLVSVLLAAPPGPATPEVPTPEPSPRAALRDWLRTLLSPQGAQVELLADGSLVLTLLPDRGTATDQAALAARCALSLKERWPEAWVVLVTGRGVLDSTLPVGEAMDRAGQLLRQLERLPASSAAQVLLDDTTAGLLGPTFQVMQPRPGTFLLTGEHLSADESRRLLGRPTPCVGREQELALLELAFATCVEERLAQAVLVLAPAGMGKSRLRHEFVRRLERGAQPVRVLLGRGDPMSMGSAYGLLGQALRRLCGVVEGEPLEVRRGRLAERLARHLLPEQAPEVLEFLGELCGLPLDSEPSPRLRAARVDPTLMGTQVARALVAFLQAECRQQPVLLVLEDLHWGDALTVRLVEEALRQLSEEPLMVLALARPELKEQLPHLWAQHLQELPLRGLGRKACERLVREVLGPQVPESAVSRLVEQAAGNALFLEELIRGVAEGRGEAPPDTVLAMLQARLLRLEPELRQVLLAASVFGRVFWPGGVQSLLGEQELPAQALAHHLRQLVGLELIEEQGASRFAEQPEYRFRHALLREAAYGLLPGGPKALGHRLAAAWLERAGESDPQVLAEHYQLGQQPEHAVHYHTRAAEQLMERNDLQGMERCVQAALALGARGEALTRLLALQAVAAFWINDFARLYDLGPVVLPELRPGSTLWCHVANGLFSGYSMGGRQQELAELTRAMLSTDPEPEARAACLEMLNFASCSLVLGGAREHASVFLARMSEVSAMAGPEDGLAQGWSCHTQCFFSYYLSSRPWQVLAWAEQASQGLLAVGLERTAVSALVLAGLALEALGDWEGAVARLRESLAVAQRVGQPIPLIHASVHLALVLGSGPAPAQHSEAQALVRRWAETEQPNLLYGGLTRLSLARAALSRGDLAEAESQARQACQPLASFPPALTQARTLLSSALRAQGRLAEAREVAAQGVQGLEAMGDEGASAVGMHLALAEACLAEGDSAAGEAALRRALRCLRARAEDVPPGPPRERFLHQVPENARVLALARERWGESPLEAGAQ